jgi:Kef-type K+ transport system membrane component KefB
MADIVVELLIILFAMFTAGRLLGRGFEYLGLPGVIGEITAGMVLGPSAFAVVHPESATYGIALEALAEIGIVVLLFSVGLETRIGDLKKVGRVAMQTAVLGVVVPLGLGAAFFLSFAPGYGLAAALFVGTAMVATSVGITARVLSDMAMTQTKTAKVILGAAVIDDILGMLVLAVVGAVAGGTSMGFIDIGIIVGEALFFVFVVLTVGPRVVDRLAGEREIFEGKRIYDKRLDFLMPARTRDSVLVLAIASCLSLAAASSFFRLAPIIGAFMAGVAFADVERRYELHDRMQPLRVFLVPFFFVLMGAKVSPAAFAADPSLVVMAGGLTALACATKYYPCRLAARSLGKEAAKAVGFGMMPRGEVGLIVAAIALETAIIDVRLFSVVVFMALGTSFIAPPLLRRAMQGGTHEKVDRRLEVAAPHEWKPPE